MDIAKEISKIIKEEKDNIYDSDDGTIVWAYFSHCSCYGYEDYKGEVKELSDKNDIHTQKMYELKEVDSGVLSIMKQRLTERSKFGLKPLILDTISGDTK